MESRDVQVMIAVVLAGIVGFALAMFLIDDDDEPVVDTAATTIQQTTATTPPAATTPAPTTSASPPPETSTGSAPVQEGPNDASCIALWNRENNAPPQAFLADLQNRQAVRVNVGATPQAPRKCLVTVIANDGGVYRFTEGAGTAFPYSPQPVRMQSSALSAGERQTDALSEEGGKLSPR